MDALFVRPVGAVCHLYSIIEKRPGFVENSGLCFSPFAVDALPSGHDPLDPRRHRGGLGRRQVARLQLETHCRAACPAAHVPLGLRRQIFPAADVICRVLYSVDDMR